MDYRMIESIVTIICLILGSIIFITSGLDVYLYAWKRVLNPSRKLEIDFCKGFKAAVRGAFLGSLIGLGIPSLIRDFKAVLFIVPLIAVLNGLLYLGIHVLFCRPYRKIR